jgi:hypothetical protein
MKIVINTCYGGYSLSHEGIMRYAELKGITLYPEPGQYGTMIYWTIPKDQRLKEQDADWETLTLEQKKAINAEMAEHSLYIFNINRDDPILVQTVEELGTAVNDVYSELKIVEIPDDVEWEIGEYDGIEHVAEVHRRWA